MRSCKVRFLHTFRCECLCACSCCHREPSLTSVNCAHANADVAVHFNPGIFLADTNKQCPQSNFYICVHVNVQMWQCTSTLTLCSLVSSVHWRRTNAVYNLKSLLCACVYMQMWRCTTTLTFCWLVSSVRWRRTSSPKARCQFWSFLRLL